MMVSIQKRHLGHSLYISRYDVQLYNNFSNDFFFQVTLTQLFTELHQIGLSYFFLQAVGNILNKLRNEI